MIRGEKVYLRALEPDDLPLLYEWENNVDNWLVSNTSAPFSKHLLRKFIETSSTDLYVNQQMRLMICEKATSRAVGCIDVFEFEPAHLRAGIGILIDEPWRRQGFALDSLRLTKEYLFKVLHLHQIFCNIMPDNTASIRLFQKAGFQQCGVKRDWIRTADGWADELMFQVFNEN